MESTVTAGQEATMYVQSTSLTSLQQMLNMPTEQPEMNGSFSMRDAMSDRLHQLGIRDLRPIGWRLRLGREVRTMRKQALVTAILTECFGE